MKWQIVTTFEFEGPDAVGKDDELTATIPTFDLYLPTEDLRSIIDGSRISGTTKDGLRWQVSK